MNLITESTVCSICLLLLFQSTMGMLWGSLQEFLASSAKRSPAITTSQSEEAAPAGGVGLNSWDCCISDQCAQRTMSEMLGAPQKPNVSHASWDRLLTSANQSGTFCIAEKSGKRIFLFFFKNTFKPLISIIILCWKCCLNQSKTTISLCFLSFFVAQAEPR